MEESGYRFGVGVLVLASAMIGVLLIAFFGAAPSLWVDRYRVSFNFPKAPKVAVDTQVLKNGVLIGRVSNISLLKGQEGVILTLELDRKYELQKKEVPRVAAGSFITGDAVVEFVEPTAESKLRRFDGTLGDPRNGILDANEIAVSEEIITDSYYSWGGEVEPSPIEFIAKLEEVVPVLNSVERAMNRFDTVGKSLESAVGDGPGLVTSAKEALDNLNNTVNTINRVAVQVEKADLGNVVANALAVLPGLFKEAQDTLTQTQRTLKGFEQFSASLEGLGKEFEGIGETIHKAVDNANIAIENIAEITEPVSQNSEQLVNNAVRAMEDLDILARDLKQFTNRLNKSDGTIAKLVDSDQMHVAVLSALKKIEASSGNIQVITQKLQPIIDDARIFTDKIARDPGQLGVRGVLSNRPQGVGLK